MSTDNKTATEVAMGLLPTTFEAWSALTPDEMRRELFERRYYDKLGSSVAPTLNQVHMMADKRGLSGEDRYTVMAYMLAQQLERVQSLLLNHLSFAPPPATVVKPNEVKL